MTKDEARRALGAELRSRKLANPMTIEELSVFCEEMYKQPEFKSHNERLAGILKWPRLGRLRTCPARPTETCSAESAQGRRETKAMCTVRGSMLRLQSVDCASPISHSFAAAVIQARRCFALILLFSSLAPAAWSTAAITASVAV
jgi:hypothetical protein